MCNGILFDDICQECVFKFRCHTSIVLEVTSAELEKMTYMLDDFELDVLENMATKGEEYYRFILHRILKNNPNLDNDRKERYSESYIYGENNGRGM